MFVASFTDSEVETLLLALKFWRYHRRDSATRRHDRVLPSEEIEVLLAKLDSARIGTRRSDDDILSELFPH
jgi:hypothetical protein